MHPGSMVVLLLATLAFPRICACDVIHPEHGGHLLGGARDRRAHDDQDQRRGIFALAAVVVAFVVGNAQFPKVVRVLVGVGRVATAPFAPMASRLYQVATLQFAVVVSVGLLATYASLSVDAISVPVARPARGRRRRGRGDRGVVRLAAGHRHVARDRSSAACCCSRWRRTPTTPQIVRQPRFELARLRAHRRRRVRRRRRPAGGARRSAVAASRRGAFDAALGFAGLIVLGLVMTGGFGAWLPAIVVLPALALFAATAPAVRLAFRFLVPLAILQFLHVYPVVGSQVAWGARSRCACRA